VKKSNIIINGMHYDANTGELLSASAHAKSSHISTTADTGPAKPANKRPVRKAAQHARRQPEPTRTLMRRAVKKPGRQKHIKTQSIVRSAGKQPLARLIVPKSVKRLDDKRLQKASRIKRSELIRHFSPVAYDYKRPAHKPAVHRKQVHPARPIAVSPPISATDQLLARAIEKANSHEQPPVHVKRQGRIKRLLAPTR
jgi:hypothetical protein